VLAAACLLLATTGSGAGVTAAAVGGAYQGATEAATATVQMVGPGLFTLALDGWGAGGWVLVAGIFLVAGCAVPSAARWAGRTRG
jgi:hypothetical protein